MAPYGGRTANLVPGRCRANLMPFLTSYVPADKFVLAPYIYVLLMILKRLYSPRKGGDSLSLRIVSLVERSKPSRKIHKTARDFILKYTCLLVVFYYRSKLCWLNFKLLIRCKWALFIFTLGRLGDMKFTYCQAMKYTCLLHFYSRSLHTETEKQTEKNYLMEVLKPVYCIGEQLKLKKIIFCLEEEIKSGEKVKPKNWELLKPRNKMIPLPTALLEAKCKTHIKPKTYSFLKLTRIPNVRVLRTKTYDYSTQPRTRRQLKPENLICDQTKTKTYEYIMQPRNRRQQRPENLICDQTRTKTYKYFMQPRNRWQPRPKNLKESRDCQAFHHTRLLNVSS